MSDLIDFMPCSPAEWRRRLAAACRLPEPLLEVLWRRDCRDEATIKAFLHPALGDLPDPDLMKGMAEGSRLLAQAVGEGAPIVIYADYDADGLTAGALLYLYLRRLGHRQLHYLLPHRVRDGYGLHPHLLEPLRQQLGTAGGPRPLLLTVDCGIGDQQAVAAARAMGFRVVVTDHHQPHGELPLAEAVLNPHQQDCPFPCKNLAGVGVAFFLLMGLRRRLVEGGSQTRTSLPNLKDFLDLVAVGTVADMVPVRGSNRILIKAGLEVLAAGGRPGLAALAEIAGIKPRYAADISFMLAPRLNAAGRIAEPEIAFRLLISEQAEEAAELAAELEQLNRSRREMSDQIYYSIRQGLQDNDLESQNILIFAETGWHPGVLGIAATRLALEFDRPAILLSLENGLAKGSGRSVAGLNLLASVAASAGCLEGYGGHAAALGLTIKSAVLTTFQQELNQRLAIELPLARSSRGQEGSDWHFGDGGLELGFIEAYCLLEPFGPGNPEPRFSLRGPLRKATVVGGKHLKFRWQQPGQGYDAIAFNQASAISLTGGPVELLFSLQRNFYQGNFSWQLKVSRLTPVNSN